MNKHVIERLGHHGDGIAAGPVFAPLTLPGEVVTGVVEGDQLRDVRIVTPSDERVSPPCRHFKSCGGCQLQHAADGFVAAWKVEVVARALEAQGIETEMRPIMTSPPASRRRATLSARRTKKGAMAGFHARSSDVIVEIPDCRLLDPEVMKALPVAEGLARVGASRRGELSLAVTLSTGGLDVAVTGGPDAEGQMLATLAQEAERHDLARLTWNGEVMATRRPPEQVFGTARVTPPPGAFLQATKAGEAALLACVREAVGPAGRVVDLFAGCGTFSLPLAETSEVHAVEGSGDMTKAMEHGWRHASGLRKLTVEARDLFRRPLLPDELSRFDAAVIDPPRAGAEAQVVELCDARIGRIAYVSCNPVTFARDAHRLVAAGYTLDWVQVVDQFRWSAHIELAAQFTLT